MNRLSRKFAIGILVACGFLLVEGLFSRSAASDGPRYYKGRRIAEVMSAEGADWLVRAEREPMEQPERVIEALDIGTGMTVADIGAGVGYFSLRLAKRVGPQGTVLAVDIQQKMLDLLETNMRRGQIENIKLIRGTERQTTLPEETADLALLVDVYHEFAFPEEMVASIRRALKSDGRMVLIEYRGEDPEVPIKPEHKMTVKQVLQEIEPMGFRLKRKLDFLPWQHILIFEKATF
ncbi:MAG: methyltransferase domain-containing protein [Acidobacteriota bacterium]